METKLFLGDCLKVLSEIKTESIHAVVTDPPYQYLDTQHLINHIMKRRL